MGHTRHPQTLAHLPAVAAQRFGSRPALVTADGQLSFDELERQVARCARGLSDLGLRRGDRVVLYLPNSWEWVVGYYAIARLGGVVVPANILLVADEVKFIAGDCQATAIVALADRAADLRASVASLVRHYIVVGPCLRRDTVKWTEVLAVTEPGPRTAVAPADISTICYTSGTTGQPKGAVLTHGAVVTNAAMTANMHVRTAADTVVTALPCSHVYGNVVLNGALLCGYTLVLLERFQAEAVLDAIERHRATLFEGVPTMYSYLLGAESLRRRDLSSLTRCTVGGQTIAVPLIKEVEHRFGCPLLELWGMTEIAGLGTTHPAYAPPKLGSIGVCLPFNECRIAALDDAARTLPNGEPGELMIRGPTVMRGYHGKTDATHQTLRADGWLHTGDIAYRDPDGYFFIVDRKKEMILTAGYNIYPSELERVIAAHPAVQMAAVGGVPDALKGEVAHAYVVLKPDMHLIESELIAHCRSHLAAYKTPKSIHFVPDLPKTSTGKIMRRALRSLIDP